MINQIYGLFLVIIGTASIIFGVKLVIESVSGFIKTFKK
jgi:hypothetical protein